MEDYRLSARQKECTIMKWKVSVILNSQNVFFSIAFQTANCNTRLQTSWPMEKIQDKQTNRQTGGQCDY